MLLVYPIVKKLKIDRKQKVILFVLFSLGSFTIMCNVAKSIAFLREPYVDAYIWSGTEITVAIICASIPSLRSLFYKRAWSHHSSHSNSRRGSVRPSVRPPETYLEYGQSLKSNDGRSPAGSESPQLNAEDSGSVELVLSSSRNPKAEDEYWLTLNRKVSIRSLNS